MWDCRVRVQLPVWQFNQADFVSFQLHSQLTFRMSLLFKERNKIEKKDFVPRFALIRSAVNRLNHRDDVYDGGMVFYNVFVFRRQAFYTAFKCVCYVSFLSRGPMLNSTFAMSESPRRFCTPPNFCNFDLFVVTYTKWTKNSSNPDLIVAVL